MDTSKQETKGPSISMRLQAATNELNDLEQLIRSGDFDGHLLRDFRGAVDNVRTTAWAVQQWIPLREQGGDAYSVLPLLSAERVRRATQLAKDLLLDLETLEVGSETQGLRDLFEVVDSLHPRLASLLKGKG